MTTGARFYGWHPCPACGQVGFHNAVSTELHCGMIDYPQTHISFCESCPVDLVVTYPTAEGLPIVQVGPRYDEGFAAWKWENEVALPRAEQLEAIVRAGGDVYAAIAGDPGFHLGTPAHPGQVPSCMADAVTEA